MGFRPNLAKKPEARYIGRGNLGCPLGREWCPASGLCVGLGDVVSPNKKRAAIPLSGSPPSPRLEGQYVRVYKYGYASITQPDGSFEVCLLETGSAQGPRASRYSAETKS
jgi:hypothetical protein